MTPEEMRDRLSKLGIESEFVNYPNKKAIGVKWQIDGIVWKYDWYGSTPQALSTYMQYSPEQAIAATVGRRTDLAKRLREVSGLHAFAELFGFDWTDDSDWTWHDVACAMADAVDAATVGAGTCKNTQDDFDFMCSECGKCVDNGRVLGFKFCPQCGRKIKEEAE